MPGVRGAGAVAAEKTATQIALEQIDYIAEVDYKGRVKDFMAVPPKDMVQESLRAMTPVVEAAIGRLDVEFCDTDLYMCMEIFDLVVWEPLLALAPLISFLWRRCSSSLSRYFCVVQVQPFNQSTETHERLVEESLDRSREYLHRL